MGRQCRAGEVNVGMEDLNAKVGRGPSGSVVRKKRERR